MRLWVAYGLIALMLAAAAVTIAYIRHNRPKRKYLRQREREAQRIRNRDDDMNAPD